MTGFFGHPSPWWHHLIVYPLYTALLVLGDEWLLRRNPHFGMVVAIVSFAVVPLDYALGVFGSGAVGIFQLAKAISLIIPLLLELCWRLAHVREECAEGSARAKQRDKVLKHTPVAALQWLESKFKGSRSHKLIARFWAFFLGLNICEAVLFEASSPQSRTGNNNWGAYFNALAGILLVISMPIPRASHHFYQVELNQYSDMIWDLRLADDLPAIAWFGDGCNKALLNFGWVVSYTLWNFEFVTRMGTHRVVLQTSRHLLIPLFRVLFPDSTTEEAPVNLSAMRWLQVRLHVLCLYVVYDKLWVNEVFHTTGVYGFPQIAFGNVLLVISAISALCAALYAYVWLRYFLPALHSTQQKVADVVDVDVGVDVGVDDSADEKL